jgi:C-terminal processing protease CtpA/Prc
MSHRRRGRAVVTDVRAASAAQRAGIRPGDEVLRINGHPVVEAATEFQPRYLSRADAVAWSWALNVAVAGRHVHQRTILLLKGASGERTADYAADDMGIAGPTQSLTAHRVGDVGHVRIHNSLGDSNFVTAFDAALAQPGPLRGLVLDLRDTRPVAATRASLGA